AMHAQQIELERIRTQAVPGVAAYGVLRIGGVNQLRRLGDGRRLLIGEAAAHVPEEHRIPLQKAGHFLLDSVRRRQPGITLCNGLLSSTGPISTSSSQTSAIPGPP